MPPLHRLLVALAAVLAVVGAAGCESADDAAVEATTTTASTTTTLITTTTAPPEPGRIIVAGDSVVFDATPALAALLGPERAEVVGMVAPALTRPAMRSELARRVAEAPTDLLVVMVGIWERAYESPSGATLGQPGWEESYVTEVLEPVRAAVSAAGARLLFLRPPPMRDAQAEQDIAALGQVWDRFASVNEDTVRYVDSSVWFESTLGFQELLTDPSTGAPVRVRRTDGMHLCEHGARRLAQGIESVLSTVVARPLPAADESATEDPAWTSRFPADECPPVTG